MSRRFLPTFVLICVLMSGVFGSEVAMADPPSQADDQTIFIVRRQTGLVAAENSYKIQCQIDADKTSRIWHKGRDPQVYEDSVPTVYTETLPDLAAVRILLDDSAKGTLTKSTGPTDGPTSRYYGVLQGTVVVRYVKLFINKSTLIYKNSSGGTDALMQLADANCVVP